MRLLLDAQLSPVLARHLRGHGYQASHVFEHLPVDANDRSIADLANRLGACVMTKDADFVDIARAGLLDHTLIWLRIPNLSNAELIQRIDQGMPSIVSAVSRSIRIAEIR